MGEEFCIDKSNCHKLTECHDPTVVSDWFLEDISDDRPYGDFSARPGEALCHYTNAP